MARSGRSIYFDAVSRDVRTLWRVNVEPMSLRWTALERLTISPGPDADLAVCGWSQL
jgi:hypothetical protein